MCDRQRGWPSGASEIWDFGDAEGHESGGKTMSAAEKPKPEQIQANVAAALSRLRGELGSSGTPAMAPKPAVEASEPKLGPVVTLPAGPVRPAEEPRGPSGSRPFEPTLGATLGGMPATPESKALAENAAHQAETLKPGDFVAGRRLDRSGDQSRIEPTLAPERATTEQPDLLAGMEVPPASPPPLGALEEDLEINEQRRKRRNRLLAAAVILVVVVGAGWAFLRNGTVEGPPPIITADTSPEKVKPVDEGGMQVPNQNVQILDNLASGQSSAAVSNEGNATVLPPPEQPVAPPAAEQNTQSGTTPSAPAVTETPPAAPATDQAQAQTGQAQTDQTQGTEAQSGQATTDNASGVSAPAIPSVSAPTIPNTATSSAGSANSANPVAQTPVAQTPVAQTAAPEPSQPEAAAKPAAKPAATQTAAAPAAKPVSAGSARVQLAAVRSEAAARSQWTKLQKLHPDLLGALSLTVQKTVRSGVTYYRIQAGPLTDKAKAKQLCAKLVAQKQDCIVAH
jgi:hypothetical protein